MRARFLMPWLLLVLASCKSPSRAPEPQTVVAASRAEALALVNSLTPALASCDEASLGALFHWDWLFRTAARASGVDAKEERALYKVLGERTGLAAEFVCEPATQMAFVGLRETGAGLSLIYRLKTETGPSYIEYRVGKLAGETRCLDRIDYRTGWHLSELLASGPRLKADVEALARLRSALLSSPQDVAKEAKKYSYSLPIQTLAVVASAYLGEKPYREALANHKSQFPEDLSVYLQVYETLGVQGAHALADEALLALQTGLGDEDGLLTARVSLLLDAKDFARATELAEQALAAHPEQQEAHYRLLEVHVENRNFAGAVAVMRLLGERFNVRFSEDGMDTTHPAYVELLASDEWSAY
jgi:hypothetical protein